MAILCDQDTLSRSVDALVNENDLASIHSAELAYILQQPRRATPVIPPGLSAPSSRLGTPGGSRIGTPVTGSVRPALPPGLPPPQHAITPAVPDILPTSRSSTPAKKIKKDSTSSKATEIRAEAVKTPTIGKSDLDKVSTAAETESKTEAAPTPDVHAETDQQDVETQDKGDEEEEKEANASEVAKAKVESPFEQPSPPTTDKTVAQVAAAADAKVTPLPPIHAESTETSDEKKAEQKSALSTAKRQHPGPLQIPKKENIVVEAASAAGSEPAKNPRASSLTASATSRPGTPTGVSGSPLRRTAPQIMRITNTPKTETPPILSATGPPPTLPSVASIRSRQPSIASINQPGTPLSEFISDAASMTSTSMSRANSPPPGSRVGSAPQRSKTKSQAKKERQERARQMADEDISGAHIPSEEPTRQEAIQSRKKKDKKKDKKTKLVKTTSSTPADSRAATPTSAEKREVVVEPAAEEEVVPEVTPPVEVPKPALTAAGIIAKLEAVGDVSHDAIENIFKSFPSGPSDRQVGLIDVPNRDRTYTLTEESLKMATETHQAQRLGGEDGRISSRVLITPAGTIMRGLSKEEEDRYLELEARLAAAKPLTKWTQTKEPIFDLDKIMRGLNVRTVLENAEKMARQQAAQSTNGATGTSANARVFDEAANYNDEFIMPASPTTPSAPATGASSSQTATPLPASTHAAQAAIAAAANAASATGTTNGINTAQFFSHYIHLNGVALSDNAGPVLGVEVGKNGFGLGRPRNGAGLQLSLSEVEKELNAEKQRTNEFTKKLNAAVKRNRKMVASAGH